VIIITETEFETHFEKYLELTAKEEIIITKNGKSIAKLIKANEEDVLKEAKSLVVLGEETD